MDSFEPLERTITTESETIAPPPEFQEAAHVSSLTDYQAEWRRSLEDPKGFWAEKARHYLDWIQPFNEVMSGKAPHVSWFEGGRLNASVQCVDRHLKGHRRNKAAIIWEGEPGDRRVLTYQDLYREVSRFASSLSGRGAKRGDRVTLYMPLVPELAIAMLACARLGLVHSVVFAGYGAQALAGRNRDAEARFLITADGGWRKGQVIRVKDQVDEALKSSPSVEQVIVFRRLGEHVGQPVQMQQGRDVWWQDLLTQDSTHQATHQDPEAMRSEDPLFLLYTSGSTGKPKGILHTTAGYMLGASLSTDVVFDLKEEDTFWCTADAGWITGHSYLVYGPLSRGASVVMYEGAPSYPDPGRFWRIIEDYGVTIFYTAPTAIRSFMKAGDQWLKGRDLSSLRLLGSVGEPINPKAWRWYHQKVGQERCPIVDTWWQTETGSIMITSLPGAMSTKPGSACMPFYGVSASVVDEQGKPAARGQPGYLVIDQPWPSMLRTIYGDDQRYRKQYWSRFPGKYFTGDGAVCDEQGYYWILGRTDDVLNVAGHRLSSMEIESALVAHPRVAEAAVVSIPHDIKGEGIVCFVTLKELQDDGPASAQSGALSLGDELAIEDELKQRVCDDVGGIARPDSIRFADALPKTRSGKIMRRVLKAIAAGQGVDSLGDISTMEDPSVLEQFIGSQSVEVKSQQV